MLPGHWQPLLALPPETAVAVPKLALKELDCTLRTNSACTAVA